MPTLTDADKTGDHDGTRWAHESPPLIHSAVAGNAKLRKPPGCPENDQGDGRSRAMVGIKETLVNGMNGLSGLNGHAATAPTRPYPPKLSYETIEAREQYTIPDHGFQDPNARKQRIIGIGAGASGIYLAIRAQQRLKGTELVIYEKNDDLGGVWLENRYPGAACDVPGHVYTYTFEPYNEWTTYYASSTEIHGYFSKVADKYKVRQFMKFQKKVTSVLWNAEKGYYDVEIEDLTKPVDPATGRHPVINDYAHNVIWQGGNLNKWKLPDIQGLGNFKGKVMHTANFDINYDFTGKKLALIGAGSSSIQVLPRIAKTAERVDAYIRSKAWISLPLVSQKSKEAGHRGENFAYSEEEKERFRNDPTYGLQYRLDMENEMNLFFSMCMKNSKTQKQVREDCEQHMRRSLAKKPELAELLVPSFGVGCRRITPGPGYLEALCQDNVNVVQQRIVAADETGVIAGDGVHREVDAIICATGFDTSFRPPFEVVGMNGYALDAEYAKDPASYLSVALPGVPNFWVVNGPQGCGANGSILPVLEQTLDYIIAAINKQRRHGIKSMVCKPECAEEFNYHTDQFVQERGVWSDSCSSWYKNGTVDGRVVAVYPGTNVAFMETMNDPRWEDYNYEYHDKASRYRVFGNGFTVGELNGEGRSKHFIDRLHTLDDIKKLHGIPIDEADATKVSAASPLPE